MDEQEKQRLLELFSNTPEDQESRQVSQNFAIDQVRQGMLSPEEKALENFQLKNLQANPTPQGNPEVNAQLEQQAMQNFNSPEAQAIRAKFDPESKQPIPFNAIRGLFKK